MRWHVLGADGGLAGWRRDETRRDETTSASSRSGAENSRQMQQFRRGGESLVHALRCDDMSRLLNFSPYIRKHAAYPIHQQTHYLVATTTTTTFPSQRLSDRPPKPGQAQQRPQSAKRRNIQHAQSRIKKAKLRDPRCGFSTDCGGRSSGVGGCVVMQ